MPAKPAKRKNEPKRGPNGKFARKEPDPVMPKEPDPVISDDPDGDTKDMAEINAVLEEQHGDPPVHISAEEIAVIHNAKPPPMNPVALLTPVATNLTINRASSVNRLMPPPEPRSDSTVS